MTRGDQKSAALDLVDATPPGGSFAGAREAGGGPGKPPPPSLDGGPLSHTEPLAGFTAAAAGSRPGPADGVGGNACSHVPKKAALDSSVWCVRCGAYLGECH